MVGDTRIELVTPSMSTKCSTAELISHETVTKQLSQKNWDAESRVSKGAIKGVAHRIKGFWYFKHSVYNNRSNRSIHATIQLSTHAAGHTHL